MCLAGLSTSTSSKARVLGFVESLLDHDIPFNDAMITWTDAHCATGYEKALELLRTMQPRPTALLCFNDVVAVGAYRAAYELGLHIPNDISVVGFDDIAMAALLGPPLTTVRASGYQVGQAAAQVLLNAVTGEDKGQLSHVRIQGELVERGSVADIRP
jgi:DNA-binding LacI/PurR family transcriptional regulator